MARGLEDQRSLRSEVRAVVVEERDLSACGITGMHDDEMGGIGSKDGDVKPGWARRECEVMEFDSISQLNRKGKRFDRGRGRGESNTHSDG